MLSTISNGTYTAQVDSLGAQLVSLKGPDGWEYIWTGDPAYLSLIHISEPTRP